MPRVTLNPKLADPERKEAVKIALRLRANRPALESFLHDVDVLTVLWEEHENYMEEYRTGEMRDILAMLKASNEDRDSYKRQLAEAALKIAELRAQLEAECLA